MASAGGEHRDKLDTTLLAAKIAELEKELVILRVALEKAGWISPKPTQEEILRKQRADHGIIG